MKQNIIERGVIGIIVVLAIIIMFFTFLHFQRTNLTISLNSATNKPTTNNLTVDFQFTVSGDEIVNCSLWTNETGSWSKTADNQTAVSNTTTNTITYTFSSDGSYLWNIQCWNSTGDYDFANSNRTINIDSITPNLAFQQPANDSNWVIRQKINISVYADESIGECILNFNGANKTVTPSGQYCNTTIYPITTGYYSLTMCVSDLAGNWNSTTNYINLTKIKSGWSLTYYRTIDSYMTHSQPVIGDADNDGIEDDIVLGTYNDASIWVLSWNGGGFDARHILDGISCEDSILVTNIVDIEEDGKNDVFAATGGNNCQSEILLYELNETDIVRNITYTPPYDVYFGHGSGNSCGDVSNDGVNKCVIGYCGGDNYGKVLLHHINYTSQNSFEIDDYKAKYVDSSEGTLVCDCDNNGQVEVYAWNGFDESSTDHIWKYNITTDNQVESSIDFDAYPNTFDIQARGGDVCGSGYNDLVVAVKVQKSTGQFELYIYNNATNTSRWLVFEDDGTLMDCALEEKSFVIGDADNDGKNEILFGTRGEDTSIGGQGNASIIMIDNINCSSQTVDVIKLADFKGLGKNAKVVAGDIDQDGNNEIVTLVDANDTTNEIRVYILEQISAGDTTPQTLTFASPTPANR